MTKPKVLLITVVIFIILLLITVHYLRTPKVVGNQALEGVSLNQISNGNPQGENPNTQEAEVQEVATNLEIPWEIVFLPNENLLVTQRPGTLLHITPNSRQSIPVSGVEHRGEGGLLGLALHPEYTTNKWIYLYLTSETENGLENRVERYIFNENLHTVTERKVILDNIPGAVFHDGGKIAFGPDGLLYITTGDAGMTELSQDTNSLAGKILRITDEGEIPQDNPFKNEVYSYGHRNPQGLAWDAGSNLWQTEHGPSGLSTGFDEVNLIRMGENYGWPVITGTKTQAGMQTPILQSGSQDTWAPAGMAIYQDTIFFAGLRGEGLYSAKISDTATGQNTLVDFKKHFNKEFGRLRAVVIDPSNEWIYISTSNTDGRGSVKENDDKIIKIRLSAILK